VCCEYRGRQNLDIGVATHEPNRRTSNLKSRFLRWHSDCDITETTALAQAIRYSELAFLAARYVAAFAVRWTEASHGWADGLKVVANA
jgi:hypothetical protein